MTTANDVTTTSSIATSSPTALPPAAARWLAELRATPVAQGRYVLRQNDGDGSAYCCLGVACELSELGQWLVAEGNEFAYATGGIDAIAATRHNGPDGATSSTGCLPELVQHQLGLAGTLGEFDVTTTWLARLECSYPATAARVVEYLHSARWGYGEYVSDVAPGMIGKANLSSLNDFGLSFAEIADVVESQPPGLFATS